MQCLFQCLRLKYLHNYDICLAAWFYGWWRVQKNSEQNWHYAYNSIESIETSKKNNNNKKTCRWSIGWKHWLVNKIKNVCLKKFKICKGAKFQLLWQLEFLDDMLYCTQIFASTLFPSFFCVEIVTFARLAVKSTHSYISPMRCRNSSTCGRFRTYTWCTVPSISTGTMKSALLMGWKFKIILL